MSDFRIALVGEGPTDAVIIEAALKALLKRPFVLTQLQPEPTRPKLGNGWGGVLRWCREFASRGFTQFEIDPTLADFDLIVIHLDADVAEDEYSNVSNDIANEASTSGWPTLPNSVGCPPPTGSVGVVRALPLAWAGTIGLGQKTVLCVPSKAVEAWLVAALFDAGHTLLNRLECNLNIATQLAAQPKSTKVKKTVPGYRALEKKVVEKWQLVRQRCSQADRFSQEVEKVLSSL
jgi:hypothetical protein